MTTDNNGSAETKRGNKYTFAHLNEQTDEPMTIQADSQTNNCTIIFKNNKIIKNNKDRIVYQLKQKE